MFGKGNVAGRERARNELERIRREEGGVIDRYEWEEFVEENAKSDPGVPSYYSSPSHDAGGGFFSDFEPFRITHGSRRWREAHTHAGRRSGPSYACIEYCVERR